MSDTTEFFVAGTPVPQGSKTIGRNGSKVWLRDANANALHAWRNRVAAEADLAVTYDVPVEVALRFILPSPKRPRWTVPAVKPDLDKLVRAVLDGLVAGGLLSDDSRVVRLAADKKYAVAGETGVIVIVREWEP